MFEFLKKLFGKSSSDDDKKVLEEEINDPTMNFLIAGLGNPGRDYDYTRHNIGFEVLDELAKTKACEFELGKQAFYAKFKHKGRQFHLIKPTTYMNLSGKAVRYWLQHLKIPQENLLVIVDDLNLPFEKIRLKAKGSDGGHNGLKSITQLLGNNKYARLRFGIGDNFRKGKQVDYVLGKWTKKESEELPFLIQHAVDTTLAFGTIGIERTMNQFNKN